MGKEELRTELDIMRSALIELESALKDVTDDGDRLLAELDQSGEGALAEVKKLQERIERLLSEQ
ncbi:MAG: hypothetical protein LBI57_01740 [Helicobacteraceae bacterium]|nr:hypothetical protein [Helicobacteraceae bacterium]